MKYILGKTEEEKIQRIVKTISIKDAVKAIDNKEKFLTEKMEQKINKIVKDRLKFGFDENEKEIRKSVERYFWKCIRNKKYIKDFEDVCKAQHKGKKIVYVVLKLDYEDGINTKKLANDNVVFKTLDKALDYGEQELGSYALWFYDKEDNTLKNYQNCRYEGHIVITAKEIC